MDSKQLIGYMTRPERLKGDAVNEMEQMVNGHPYFAIGQTLLAIAYQNTGDERYESQLRRTAAIMPNRDKLRLFTLIAKHRFESEPEMPALPDEIPPTDNVFSNIEPIETAEEQSSGIIQKKVFIIPHSTFFIHNYQFTNALLKMSSTNCSTIVVVSDSCTAFRSWSLG